MKRSRARVGWIVVWLVTGCAQSTALDEELRPGGGGFGEGAELVDAGSGVRPADDEPGEEPIDEPAPDEEDAGTTLDDPPANPPDASASTRPDAAADAATPPRDASQARDTGTPSSAPADASAPTPRDAAVAGQCVAAQCSACPPPGQPCCSSAGRCGCALFPFGLCLPPPPFFPLP